MVVQMMPAVRRAMTARASICAPVGSARHASTCSQAPPLIASASCGMREAWVTAATTLRRCFQVSP